ncbi:MAG: hypothetical protein ABIX37_12730 [Gammaproteobacteria bacterium]
MIEEPMTLFTDYVMVGVAGWLGFRLFVARDGQAARSYWTLAFAAVTFGAALGGTSHGFAKVMDQDTLQWVWKVTVLAIGIGSFGMVAGSAMAVTVGLSRRLWLAIAAVEFALYAWWILDRDDFIYVIADSGFAMALVGALHAGSAMRGHDRASYWMLGGVGVSVLAAGAQASGFDLHRNFNHNDLYHVIQIAAMPLFYVGARALRDRVSPVKLA